MSIMMALGGLAPMVAPVLGGTVLTLGGTWRTVFWFLAGFGYVLMYPVGHALSWGVGCYLRARQQNEGIPPAHFGLDDSERSALQELKKILPGVAGSAPGKNKGKEQVNVRKRGRKDTIVFLTVLDPS